VRCDARNYSAVETVAPFDKKGRWSLVQNDRGSDRRNRREHSDQNGQRQKPTEENRHLVHAALLNVELAVHRALRDEGLPRVTELPGYSERLTEPVTEADPAEKYGSDANLIRSAHALVFRSAHNSS